MSDTPPSLARRAGLHSDKEVKGKPTQKHVGRETYDALMALTAPVPESPTSPLGVFVANSTKRDLKRQMESLIRP